MTRTCPEPTLPRSGRPSRDRRLLRGYLHKTSNSLCGIKGYASLIAAPAVDDDPAVVWARKIISEVEKMEQIFRSVGDLTTPRGNPDVGVDLPRLLGDVNRHFLRRRLLLGERDGDGLRTLTHASNVGAYGTYGFFGAQDFFLDVGDAALDIFRRLGRLPCEFFDFGGHDGEAAAHGSGSSGFNRCI